MGKIEAFQSRFRTSSLPFVGRFAQSSAQAGVLLQNLGNPLPGLFVELMIGDRGNNPMPRGVPGERGRRARRQNSAVMMVSTLLDLSMSRISEIVTGSIANGRSLPMTIQHKAPVLEVEQLPAIPTGRPSYRQSIACTQSRPR